LVYSVECFKYGFGACAAGKRLVKVRRKVVVGGRELIGLILPSKQLYFVSNLVSGRVGLVGNRQWQLTILKKAGRNRNLGRRPTVRGVAMNPVDHPHGGGEESHRWKNFCFALGLVKRKVGAVRGIKNKLYINSGQVFETW